MCRSAILLFFSISLERFPVHRSRAGVPYRARGLRLGTFVDLLSSSSSSGEHFLPCLSQSFFFLFSFFFFSCIWDLTGEVIFAASSFALFTTSDLQSTKYKQTKKQTKDFTLAQHSFSLSLLLQLFIQTHNEGTPSVFPHTRHLLQLRLLLLTLLLLLLFFFSSSFLLRNQSFSHSYLFMRVLGYTAS